MGNVGIVEDPSDIDTIVGAQAPYDPEQPSQNWKQVTASQWGWRWFTHAPVREQLWRQRAAVGRNWVLIGDDRLFFLFSPTPLASAGMAATATASGPHGLSSRVTTTPPCCAADDNFSG